MILFVYVVCVEQTSLQTTITTTSLHCGRQLSRNHGLCMGGCYLCCRSYPLIRLAPFSPAGEKGEEQRP
jgi:hypothetical protein